jgi:prepilin-type N-terminal cleavage/methylation domain-containing protein
MMKFQRYRPTPSADNSGFTLIESLIGIVIVAILLASTSPILVMSTAIRVQSKRIEKAAQVANTFIDGVRVRSITAPGKIIGNGSNPETGLDPATSAVPRTLSDNLIIDNSNNTQKMPPPTQTSASSNTNQDLYLSEKDGTICLVGSTGCATDTSSPFDEFYIQAAQIKVKGKPVTDGYRLAIRVYRADVDFTNTLLASSSNVKTVDSPVTQGMGNKQAPLIERTVDIASSTTTFNALCSRLGIAQKTVIISGTSQLQNQDCPQ